MKDYEMELIDYACKQVGLMLIIVFVFINTFEVIMKIVNKKVK